MAKAKRMRSRCFTLYLLDEEYEVLEIKANNAKMSKSEFMRNVILFGAAHERTLMPKDESEKFLYELNRIGNNINQIAWRANSLKGADRSTLLELIDQYDLLVDNYENLVR